ncbi:hypothetical protein Dsin_011651 [Dipteronia sinensis]|uniref:C3H1-type domain-containing protein n=1 Tax=Dipteronia sinensis TaxID=43782 RepID=A0AAE0AGS8_9ROSI|nr:hypothetical protein Dsin_011651 [Dipteronia sinensis]
MLKGVSNFSFYNFGEVPLSGVNLTAKQYNNAIDDAIYGSDDFRMFGFKIKRCTKLQSHHWNDCPYAHRGERAQRLDPRKVSYSAILCRSYRTGNCPKGNYCEHSHDLFEYWLHPDRYRTRPCNAGMFCQRKVRFFAHTAEQLRSEPRLWCHFVYPGTTRGGDRQYQQQYYQYNDHDVVKSSGSSGGGHRESVTAATTGIIPAESSPSSVATHGWPEYRYEEVEEVLKSLRGLDISDNGDHDKKEPVKTNNIRGSCGGFEVSNPDLDLPHLEWIADLVE